MSDISKYLASIGHTGTDEISKIKGTIVSVSVYWNNWIQYTIQTAAIKGELKDPVGFDVQQIKVTKKAGLKKIVFAEHEPEMGDLVEDTVTGFKGTVAGITYWMNGCIHMVVSPKVDDKNVSGKNQAFDYTRLKILEQAATSVEPTKSTGGPNMRVSRSI